jgi:hypothetical protein
VRTTSRRGRHVGQLETLGDGRRVSHQFELQLQSECSESYRDMQGRRTARPRGHRRSNRTKGSLSIRDRVRRQQNDRRLLGHAAVGHINEGKRRSQRRLRRVYGNKGVGLISFVPQELLIATLAIECLAETRDTELAIVETRQASSDRAQSSALRESADGNSRGEVPKHRLR